MQLLLPFLAIGCEHMPGCRHVFSTYGQKGQQQLHEDTKCAYQTNSLRQQAFKVLYVACAAAVTSCACRSEMVCTDSIHVSTTINACVATQHALWTACDHVTAEI